MDFVITYAAPALVGTPLDEFLESIGVSPEDVQKEIEAARAAADMIVIIDDPISDTPPTEEQKRAMLHWYNENVLPMIAQPSTIMVTYEAYMEMVTADDNDFSVQVDCLTCDGSGEERLDDVVVDVCPDCGGSGDA